MTGEKKGTDFSSRLKRSGKIVPRKASTTSISAPPKAAIASNKPKKDEVHRRKNPFNEMLLQKKNPRKSIDTASTPEDSEARDTRESSIGSSSVQDRGVHDRIAELEKALDTARREQEDLKAELERAKESATGFRQALEERNRSQTEHQNVDRPSSPDANSHDYDMEYELETSHRHSSDLIEQNYSLRVKVAELQEQLVQQDAAVKARVNRELYKDEEEWDSLTARLHDSEKIAQERSQQLLDLKHSISSLTRVGNQVTDSELAERLDQLYHRLREWVISNFRRSKLDFTDLPLSTSKIVESIIPDCFSISSSDKIAFYQAIVSSNLMHIFKEPIMSGIPETGPLSSLRQLAAYIHDTGSDYREWRRTTIRCLEKGPAHDILQRQNERQFNEMASQIISQLTSISSVEASPTAHASLEGILSAAASFHRTLLMQRAQYKFHFFRKGEDETYFDSAKMDSIYGDGMDDDVFMDKKFEFCVFPLLEKFGDEAGENLQVRNVLLKGKVCCGVG